jgi:hypothetical protein
MTPDKTASKSFNRLGIEVIGRQGSVDLKELDVKTGLPRVVLIEIPANKESANQRIWDNASVATGLDLTNQLINKGKTFEVYIGHHQEAQREGVLPAGKILPHCRVLNDGTAYIPVELIYQPDDPVHPGLIIATRIKKGEKVKASMVAYLDCENPDSLTGYCTVEKNKPVGIDFLDANEDPGIEGTEVVAVVESKCQCNGQCKPCQIKKINQSNQQSQTATEVKTVATLDKTIIDEIMKKVEDPAALKAWLEGMLASTQMPPPTMPPTIPLIEESEQKPAVENSDPPIAKETEEQPKAMATETGEPQPTATESETDQNPMAASEGDDPAMKTPATESNKSLPKATANKSIKPATEKSVPPEAMMAAIAKATGMTPGDLTRALQQVARKASTEMLTNDLRKKLNQHILTGQAFAGMDLSRFSIVDFEQATRDAAKEAKSVADGNPVYADGVLKIKLKEVLLEKDRKAISEASKQIPNKGLQGTWPGYGNQAKSPQGYLQSVEKYRTAFALNKHISQAAQENLSKDPRFLEFSDAYRNVFARQYGPALDALSNHAQNPSDSNRRAAQEALGQVGVREIANLPEAILGAIEQSFFTSPAFRLTKPYPIGGSPDNVVPSGLRVSSINGQTGEFIFITHETYNQPTEVSGMRNRGDFTQTPKITSYQKVTQHFANYDEVTTDISYHIWDQMMRNPYQKDVLNQIERNFMSYYTKTRELDIMAAIYASCVEYGAVQIASIVSPETVANVSTHWAFGSNGTVSYAGYTFRGKAAVGLRCGDAPNVANQTRRLVVPPRLSRVNLNGDLGVSVLYPVIAEVTVGGAAVIHKVGFVDRTGRVKAANPKDGNPATEPFIGVTLDGVVVFSEGSNITQTALETGGVRFLGYHAVRNSLPLVVKDTTISAKELGTRIIKDVMTARSNMMSKRHCPPPDFLVCADPIINALSFAEATTGDTQVNFAAVQAAFGNDSWGASQIRVRGLGFETSTEDRFNPEKVAVMSAAGLVVDYPLMLPIASRGLSRAADGNVIGAESVHWRWSSLTTAVPQIGLLDDNPTGEPIFGITNFPGIVFHIPEPTVSQPILS